MSKKLYPDTDVNDLVATELNHEEEFFKGRGPDKKPRKKRESYKGHDIEQTGGSYTHMTDSGSKTHDTPHTEEHHVTLPDGKPYHTTFSSREHAKAHIDKLTTKK